MKARIYSLVLLTYLVTLGPAPLQAGTKAWVNGVKAVSIEVEVNQHGKKQDYQIWCLNKVPGELREKSGKLQFRSFKQKISGLDSRRRKKRAGLAKKLLRAGRLACSDDSEPGVPAEPPLPPPPNVPVAPLERYSGPFGVSQARTLCNRVRFGCTQSEIEEFVRIGLEQTVNKITVYMPDDVAFEAVQNDLECDGYREGENYNEDAASCVPSPSLEFNNKNTPYGLIQSYLYGALSSKSPYIYRLMFFLHNRFMAANLFGLDYAMEQHASKKHIDMVKEAAISGDYREFMHRWPQDYLGHLKWLDGASNSGQSPNENFAREYWQLGTMGVYNLEGVLNYSDLDVAQAALAFSGWRTEFSPVFPNPPLPYYDRYATGKYDKALHAGGTKRVFQGTPYEAQVGNWEGIWHATLRHPRTPQYLAEKLWQEFIGTNYTADNIRSLAESVRLNQYNLHPVIRELMLSKHMFEETNRKAIIRNPIDILVGFYRTIGITDYILSAFVNYTYPVRGISTPQHSFYYLQSIRCAPFLPPTVFGFNERSFVGTGQIAMQRNHFDYILSLMQNRVYGSSVNSDPRTPLTSWEEAVYTSLTQGIEPNSGASQAAVERVASILNIDLNEEQINLLKYYLDNQANCESGSNIEECDTYYTLPFIPNPVRDSYEDYLMKSKLLGLIAIIISLPQFMLT